MDPLHEADLHGRTQRIISRESQMKELMFSDPEWCDPELAGWWIWAQSAHLAQAVIRTGVKAKPNNTAQGIFSLSFCQEYLKKITERLQTVQILCGDFSRVLTNSYLMHEKQIVGVYLDPPYALGDSRTYGQDLDHQSVWNRTVRWAAQNCQNKRLRIVLSGYRGSPGCDMLEEAGMTRHDFQAPQGHSSKNKDNNNSSLESCWISRACVGFNFEQLGLFA